MWSVRTLPKASESSDGFCPGDVVRVMVLFLLGCLLVSAKHYRLAPSTGVLQQIAGAYLLAWALLRLPRRAQLPAGALLLAGLWAAFTFVPAPGVRPGSWAPGNNLAEFDRCLLEALAWIRRTVK